jgi:hypothetical protein
MAMGCAHFRRSGWRGASRKDVPRAACDANRIDKRNGIIATIFKDRSLASIARRTIVGIEHGLHLVFPSVSEARQRF